MKMENGRIIVPGAQPVARQRADGATIGDFIGTRIRESLGPIAVVLDDLMERQKQLEAHCGFTYVPKDPGAPPPLPPGGDV